MAFEQKTWTARQGTGLNKYTDVNTGQVYELMNTPDNVIIQGDAFTAANMNGLEERIASGFAEMAAAVPETLSGWTVTQEGLSTGTPMGVNLQGIIYQIGTSSAGVRYYHVQGYLGTVIAEHNVVIAAGSSRLQLNFPSSYGSLVYLRGTALTAQALAEGHHMVIFIEGSNAHYPVICYDQATPGGQFNPPSGNNFQCLDFIIGFEDA